MHVIKELKSWRTSFYKLTTENVEENCQMASTDQLDPFLFSTSKSYKRQKLSSLSDTHKLETRNSEQLNIISRCEYLSDISTSNIVSLNSTFNEEHFFKFTIDSF